MCPPCIGPRLDRTCMAHKGRGLDHRPWLDMQSSEEKDIHFVAQPYVSHPLHPFIAARPQERDGSFDVFADAPVGTCPHHCPSVIRARSYCWACASQRAPPRPIDPTGTRVGCGVHWHHQPRMLPKETSSVYRGEWHAQSDVPDGLGIPCAKATAPVFFGSGTACTMPIRPRDAALAGAPALRTPSLRARPLASVLSRILPTGWVLTDFVVAKGEKGERAGDSVMDNLGVLCFSIP